MVPAFTYRCPHTEETVQGWADAKVVEHGDTYVPMECPACRQMHYVNPTTGKVVGANDEE